MRLTSLLKSDRMSNGIESSCLNLSVTNGLSTQMPNTAQPSDDHFCQSSRKVHISVLQTELNASGKKRSTTFCLPNTVDRSTSWPGRDGSLKAGALEPMVTDIRRVSRDGTSRRGPGSHRGHPSSRVLEV